jgi:hypothetical protein
MNERCSRRHVQHERCSGLSQQFWVSYWAAHLGSGRRVAAFSLGGMLQI